MKKSKKKEKEKQKLVQTDTYAETAPKDPREEMYEELTAERPIYTVVVEDAPVSLARFFPEYRYRFDGANAKSGDEFIREFTKFIEANEYLAAEEDASREYAAGFARAVAATALFLDSCELNPQ